MEDDRFAVGARLDVELDPVAAGDRRLEGAATILDPPAAMQPAMRERPCDQQRQPTLPLVQRRSPPDQNSLSRP